MAAYCAALQREIRQMGERYADARISTVFLGGGTPTLVPPALMGPVLDTLRSSFAFLPDVEWTSEGNPGTLTDEWLDMAMSRGLNRLSLGVQAAQDRLLKKIGRIHSFAQAAEAVRLARRHGIRNLNLDAMFGLPDQSREDYRETLAALCALEPEHLSAYSLILEEGTRLWEEVHSGRMTLPQEDETAAMYEEGIDLLKRAGYERYEISNFARPGMACRHNLGYWQGEWYLGLGVAAHSMLPPGAGQDAVRVRRAHGTDMRAYIAGTDEMETELIGAEEAMFETMMLGLRTTAGVSGARFAALHGLSMRERYGRQLDALAADGLGLWTEDGFCLTPRGLEVQNEALLRLWPDA